MDYKALGKRIKEQRLQLGLTQEKFSEKAGISESFLGHIERGGRKLSLETLVKISNALNVSIDSLIIDSVKLEPDMYLSGIIKMLNGKDKQQVKAFMGLVKVLAENIDQWTG